MNKRRDKPDCKTCTKHQQEGQVPAKTHKGHKEKQCGRHNTQQGPFAVTGHKVEIAGMVQIQPDKKNKTGQRHDNNKPRQRRQFVPFHYPGAEDKNAHTNQYLYYKSYLDCPHVTASESPKNSPRTASNRKNI